MAAFDFRRIFGFRPHCTFRAASAKAEKRLSPVDTRKEGVRILRSDPDAGGSPAWPMGLRIGSANRSPLGPRSGNNNNRHDSQRRDVSHPPAIRPFRELVRRRLVNEPIRRRIYANGVRFAETRRPVTSPRSEVPVARSCSLGSGRK